MTDIEMEQRARVVAEARSWIGTPYHNCGDLKGIGVDCGMLIVRVFVDSRLCAPFDPRPYSADWHLHRSEEKYLGFVLARSTETSAPLAGDIAVFRWGRCYSHGGIISCPQPLTIVHAYHPARRVIEEEIRNNVALADPQRTAKFFSVWAKSSIKSSVKSSVKPVVKSLAKSGQ